MQIFSCLYILLSVYKVHVSAHIRLHKIVHPATYTVRTASQDPRIRGCAPLPMKSTDGVAYRWVRKNSTQLYLVQISHSLRYSHNANCTFCTCGSDLKLCTSLSVSAWLVWLETHRHRNVLSGEIIKSIAAHSPHISATCHENANCDTFRTGPCLSHL